MDACRCPLRCIVPPGLLLRIIRDRTRAEGPWTAALETLAIDQTFRHRRAESAARMAFAAPRPAVPRISAGKPHRIPQRAELFGVIAQHEVHQRCALRAEGQFKLVVRDDQGGLLLELGCFVKGRLRAGETGDEDNTGNSHPIFSF